MRSLICSIRACISPHFLPILYVSYCFVFLCSLHFLFARCFELDAIDFIAFVFLRSDKFFIITITICIIIVDRCYVIYKNSLYKSISVHSHKKRCLSVCNDYGAYYRRHASAEVLSFLKEFKGPLLGLRQFLKIESPLKMMKNAFYYMSKALFVLEIFTSLL